MKPPTACYWLDNKDYYFPPPADGRPRERKGPPATPFMCLRTHEAFGPDGGEASETCCSGPNRPCYKPEVDL
jgi:hypothetical protein